MRNGDLFRRCRIIRNLYSVSNQRWFRNASHGNWCRLPCRLFSVHDGERLQIPQRHQGMSVGGWPCSIPEAVRSLLQGQRLQGFRSVYRAQGSQEVHCDSYGSSDIGTCGSSDVPSRHLPFCGCVDGSLYSGVSPGKPDKDGSSHCSQQKTPKSSLRTSV